jgi:CHASE1-domain containing sensor protein
MENEETKAWHVEKGVPIAVILTIALQTVALVWWASSLTFRVEKLEQQVSAAAWQSERIIRLDERLVGLQTSIAELKTLVLKQKP